MLRRIPDRLVHYALLLAITAGMTLPNLGAATLWDIDEGNNAEAAREMYESGNWVVPTFNFQLRPDKPALLYWLQMTAYRIFGVNEFAARLPSALAALGAVLVTYELGRRLFGAKTGLLAGVVLASTASFCVAAHFANPDALLNLFTALALLVFWFGYVHGGNKWFWPYGLCTGLAMLTKGPVGFVLPLFVIGLFLLWTGALRRLLTFKALWGGLVFALVVAPWYALVGVETKADFLRGFFLVHNVGRYLAPMEHHSGPVYYYLIVLLVGLAPWSVFTGLAAWSGVKELRGPSLRRGPQAAELKFLVCWVSGYLAFFSFSGTKLPNYVLPLFPPLAILTARFLECWRIGTIRPSPWTLRITFVCLALVGVATTMGLLVAGGAIPSTMLRGQSFPGLQRWAVLGLLPVVGALAVWWSWRRQRLTLALTACAATAVCFLGSIAACAAATFNQAKAPAPLVHAFHHAQRASEIRVACYQYFQPTLVFYCQREVRLLDKEVQVLDYLRCPLPVYLFMPATVWEGLEGNVVGPHSVLARQRDLYRNCDVVVVTNR